MGREGTGKGGEWGKRLGVEGESVKVKGWRSEGRRVGVGRGGRRSGSEVRVVTETGKGRTIGREGTGKGGSGKEVGRGSGKCKGKGMEEGRVEGWGWDGEGKVRVVMETFSGPASTYCIDVRLSCIINAYYYYYYY